MIRMRPPSTTTVRMLCLVLALTACSDDPVRPRECGARLDGMCWVYLGLRGNRVLALAETEWGLYAGTADSGVFRFDVSARRWMPLGLDRVTVWSLLFVPGSTKRLLAAVQPRGPDTTAALVFASVDRGASWHPWDGGTAAANGYRGAASSLAVDPEDPDRLFMGLSYAVLRSLDGGASWQYVVAGPGALGTGINGIVVAPGGSGFVAAGGQDSFGRAVIHRSIDGGETWTSVDPTPAGEDAVLALILDPTNSRRLWAGLDGSVRQSDDFGATWRIVLITPNPTLVKGLADLGDMLYAAGDELLPGPGGIPIFRLVLYRTGDGGASWDSLRTPAGAGAARTMIAGARGRLLIGTESGVWEVGR